MTTVEVGYDKQFKSIRAAFRWLSRKSKKEVGTVRVYLREPHLYWGKVAHTIHNVEVIGAPTVWHYIGK